MDAAVHVVMGTEEARVVTSALGFFAAQIGHDIESAPDDCEEDRKNLMFMLSLQFSAQNMHEHLAEMLMNFGEDVDDE